MAVAEYYEWVGDNRPITPAQPIREFVERLRVQFPEAAKQHLFSWYADSDHYQADRPQDHTPYSYTPWPNTPNPYPYVFATDVMHRPDLGVDCVVLFNYWITEARAGRMPWLKYMIWQAKGYDVRNNWQPSKGSGHFDHIHLSGRTDHINTKLGTWSIVPGGTERDMTPEESKEQYYNAYRTWGMQTMQDPIVIPANAARGVPTRVEEPNLLARAIRSIQAWEPTEEELAEISAKVEAAAYKGAEAGSLSEEQVEEASFRAAQRAEDV